MRALAVLLALCGTAAADPASDLLAQVRATYAKAPQVTAHFEQTVINATFGRTTQSSGTLYVAKPDHFRWDYAAARQGGQGKSFIYDGKTLWVVDPPNLQVIKNSVTGSKLPAAIMFWTGDRDLTADFDAKLTDNHTIELVPKQASAQLAKLVLVIDGATVKQSIVIDSNGDKNMFTFSNVDTRSAIAPKFFAFDPRRVPTYRVIEVDPGLSRPLPAPSPTKPSSKSVGDFPGDSDR
jgi:chaperone LolA